MIVVLDFGSQYTHLITRRLREFGVWSEIFPHTITLSQLPATTKGIILSGGPMSVYEKNAPKFNSEILNRDVPILGICYGHQLLAQALGGKVVQGKRKEYGHKLIKINGGILLKGLKKNEAVWFSHGDNVVKLPAGFKTTAWSGKEIAAYENHHIFGIQFHPEVAHTQSGQKILKNFIKLCRIKTGPKLKDQIENIVKELAVTLKNKPTLIGVSGGIDSLVASVILKRAIGNYLYCIFVDTGLLRKDEAEEVESLYKKLGFKNFIKIDASRKFLRALKGISDPEIKRKKIGFLFIRIFENIAKTLKKKKDIKFLAQGTIYPDRVESAATSASSAKIKSHHNLTLPKKLSFKIVEPLKDFYKDEVRALGKELGLPKEYLERHPFPGPGLAIRIVGEVVTQEKLKIAREADAIFIEELRRAKLYDKIWEAFAALLPTKTVGVMGDARTYEYTISLRAVTSKDGMTADWAKIPNRVLEKISSRIVNEVKGVNRVVYDITQKPPATIQYE